MKKTYILLILIIASPVMAKKTSTQTVMQGALDSLVQLMPYMSSPMKYQDPKFQKKIEYNLEKMSLAFKQAKHNRDINLPTFYPNYKMLTENVDEALLNFKYDNKTFSRLRLNETANLCLSCHSQLPKDKLSSYLINETKLAKTYEDEPQEQAHLYFILRKYDKALSLYNKHIKSKLTLRNKKKNKDEIEQGDHFDKSLYQSLYRTTLIYMKILREPKKALSYLNELEKKFIIPKYLSFDFNRWKEQTKSWTSKKNIALLSKQNEKNVQALLDLMEKKTTQKDESATSGSFDIDLMVMSGYLANYNVNSPKNKFAGEILYWLGVSEYRLNKTLFFNIGDLYLKGCIRSHSKKKIAKKCFEALESETQMRYTGSAGKSIPKSVQKSLNELKKLL